MGRSISRPTGQPSGSFLHRASRSSLTIASMTSGMSQRISRAGLSAERRIEFVIGSGNAAFGYLVKIGQAVFQSPIAYYSRRGKFDMAPGMEAFEEPDFNRPATPECLWCHSGRPRPLAGTVNRYREEVFEAAAISCDRCHGPVDAHLRSPSPSTIVNPAKLKPARRDSVCEQCHLSGEARILNPGSDYGDFRPGMLLEDVLSVYVFDDQGRSDFKVVSHSEQLRRSRCYRASAGAMWCGTCHNPHQSPSDRTSYFRSRCESCHQSLAADHGYGYGDCVGCHMGRRQSRDSGHSAFTDHQIRRRIGSSGGASGGTVLEAWREPAAPFRERNLGIAYTVVGERQASPRLVRKGLEKMRGARRDFAEDASLWDWIGLAEMRLGRPRQAVRAYERAVALNPRFPLYRTALAAAYWETGQATEAVGSLEQAIELDPGLESSYHMLAEIERAVEDTEAARAVWHSYLEWNPQSLTARARLRQTE